MVTWKACRLFVVHVHKPSHFVSSECKLRSAIAVLLHKTVHRVLLLAEQVCPWNKHKSSTQSILPRPPATIVGCLLHWWPFPNTGPRAIRADLRKSKQ